MCGSRAKSEHKWWIVLVCALLALTLGLAACGGGDDDNDGADEGTAANTTEEVEVTPVSLRLDYTPAGHHVPFYYGLDQGCYEEEGLDLEILPGQGSGATATTVGSGEDDFGWISLVLVPLAERNPITAVAGIIRKGGFGLLVDEGGDISSFSDLPGKTVVASRAGTQYPLLLGVLNSEGVSDEVTINNAGTNAEAIYAGGQGDAVGTLTWYAQPFVDPRRPSQALSFWDAGMEVMDYGIVTSSDKIESDPDLVRRFVAATVKSWTEAEANPDEAIDAFTSANPSVEEEVTRQQFEGALRFMDTPATEGEPVGFIAEEDWASQLEVAQEHLDCTDCESAADAYTNDFLP